MKEFSEIFSKLRKDRNKTQDEIAAALHVSRQAVSKWETGKSLPSIDMLQDIAKYFDVPIAELLSNEQSGELAYRNTQQLQTMRKTNKLIMAGIALAVLLSILGLIFGLVFGLKSPMPENADSDNFVGLFYDLTSSSLLRDGEYITAKALFAEKKPLVLYTKTYDENGQEKYVYQVYGIRASAANVGPNASFTGTLYYDNAKMAGKALHLYEIYSRPDGELQLRYFWRADNKNGAIKLYHRNNGFSKENDSLREIKITTSSHVSFTKVVLTERDENFSLIKQTDIPLSGMEYTLDPATCYVVIATTRLNADNPSTQTTLTNLYTTADLSKTPSIWLHNNDENGFCSPTSGFLKFLFPKTEIEPTRLS